MKIDKENSAATGLVDIIRGIISQEIAKTDSTAICMVESVNSDGTLNLYVLPDRQNIIRNIINQCRYNFTSGDSALLYLIGNKLSNSFVIAKYNAKQDDEAWK